MIVVRIRGGLGNQLFQYAIGRQLAESNECPLRLDLRWYSHQSGSVDRQPNLTEFDIKAQEASAADIRRIFRIGPVPVRPLWVHCLNRAFERFSFLPTEAATRLSATLLDYYWEVQDSPPPGPLNWPYTKRFYPGILDLGPEVYLAGFWQSPKYFQGVSDRLREELNVRKPLAGKNRTVAGAIDDQESVAVHIRRGDFLEHDGALPLRYYRHAVDELEKRVDEPTYFVFSNEPDWAEQNLELGPDTHVVSHNDGDTDYEDLRLMRRCDHQIIANSTFSWWGAWLNDNPGKHVLMPWRHHGPGADFVPAEWISVDF